MISGFGAIFLQNNTVNAQESLKNKKKGVK